MERRRKKSISLPEPLWDWVEQQVNAGLYQSAGDCIEDVLRRARPAGSMQEVESLVLQAARSGNSGPYTRQHWDGLEAGIRRRAAMRSRRKSA
jgi:Arc/MetJ-type ribon-helix-helix transcriptional regulator